MDFRDQTALITGAGGGIGRALAQALAVRGCHLALADIDPSGLEETVRLVSGKGLRISAHRLDVADRAAVAALPEAVKAAHGGLDCLINNAGVAVGGTFDVLSERDFDWLFEINFHGLTRMTRAFLPLLRERPRGWIVNLSSLYGLLAPPGQTAYCASKYAVRGFSEALRHELAGSSVGLTLVHPGGVATAIARNARRPKGVDTALSEREFRRVERLLTMPPERAAEIILRATEREKARVIVGSDARIAALIAWLAPASYWKILGRLA